MGPLAHALKTTLTEDDLAYLQQIMVSFREETAQEN